VYWLDKLGHYELPIERHPDGQAVRKKPNHYVTGRDGGRDIDLRKFAQQGMQLHGRLLNIDEGGFEFGDDLERNLDRADATSERIKNTIDEFIAKAGISAPQEARYTPVWQPRAQRNTLGRREAKVAAVIWCMGFSLDYRYIELAVFDAAGYPAHTRGVTAVPGLYFLGLPWLYTWGSGRFCGVGNDAQHLASCIAREPVQALTA
jgi:putative flavoprotein involved in K+ transport